MPIIHDNEIYLLSGVSTNATGTLNVRGFNNLNFNYFGEITAAINASGDISLKGRVIDNSPFVDFFNTQLRGSSGNYVAYSNVTWNSVRAVVSNYSGGAITIVARAQS
ncbi:MAG: hypothetical protein AABY22_10760 [Nanoarchaeota archaeon]